MFCWFFLFFCFFFKKKVLFDVRSEIHLFRRNIVSIGQSDRALKKTIFGPVYHVLHYKNVFQTCSVSHVSVQRVVISRSSRPEVFRKIYEISKNTFSYRTSPVAASAYLRVLEYVQKMKTLKITFS